jgi:poly(A) polymerase
MQSIRLEQILTIAASAAKREGMLVFMVGGSVRLMLAGKRLSDLDLVVDAPRGAARLAEILSDRVPYASRPVAISSFPTVEVRCGDVVIQISEPLRSVTMDISGVGGPLSAAMKQDALRRDFTINTLLCLVDFPRPAGVIDPLGSGLSDLESRILRTPIDPHDTLSNDPVRMLRAMRFANLDDFRIETFLGEAIRGGAPKIASMPGERINYELSKILTGPRPGDGVRVLREYDLLRFILPEVEEMAGIDQPNEYHGDDVLTHTLTVLNNIRPELRLRLAALMHDIGKRSTRAEKGGRVSFHGHQYSGAGGAKTALQRLRYPAKLIDEVAGLVEMHMVAYRNEWSDTAVRRLVRRAGEQLEDLMELYRADILARRPPYNDLSEHEDLRRRLEQIGVEGIRRLSSPLSGDDVMEILGLEPGPQVGKALEAIESAIVDGKIGADRDSALRFLRDEYAPRQSSGEALR